MSRRLANLLASFVAAGLGSVGVHLYLQNAEPMGPRGSNSESPPRLTMKFDGIAPKRPLRIAVEEGYEERVRFTLRTKTRSSTESASGRVPRALPEAEYAGMDFAQVGEALGARNNEREGSFTIELEVDEADAETITIEWDVKRANVLGEPDAAWKRAVSGAKKLRGRTVITRTGMPLEASIDGESYGTPAAAEISTTIRRWMAEPAPVFPPDPVGHGAIWEVSRDLVDSGVSTSHTARLEIGDHGPDQVVLLERGHGVLNGSTMETGDHLAVLDPYARQFRLTGDGSWTAPMNGLVATGEGGAKAALDIVFGLGIAEMTTTSETQMELVVDRP